MAEDARQPVARIRYRRLHALRQELRRADFRVLRRRQIDLRGEDPQWFYAFIAGEPVQAVHGVGDRRVPVREPSGSRKRAVGAEAYRGENESVPMAETGARRAA